MTAIFQDILNMSITGSVIALVIILMRAVLKNAPKKYSYFLWGILGIRLICPFSFSSVLSVFNIFKPKTQGAKMAFVLGNTSDAYFNIPLVHKEPVLSQTIQDSALQISSIQSPLYFILSVVWALGVTAFFVYTVSSFIGIKKRIHGAKRLYDNVYESSDIPTAFVFGIFSPKIYLPSGIRSNDMAYIIAHEKAHIRRFDHITKLVAMLILSIHWFNPLVWLSYKLMVLDMELSCDESAVASFDKDIKKEYASALLNMSAKQNGIKLSGILAFGENNTKKRINGVLANKKTTLIISVVAIAAVLICAVCLLTNSINKNEDSVSPQTIIDNENAEAEITPDKTVNDSSAVADNDESSQSDVKPKVELTKESAELFVSDILSSFVIYDDNTAEFLIPDVIPTDINEKTKLTITFNATYVEDVGSYSVKSFLDYETDWNGGEKYQANLNNDNGRLHELMLRVAFMTKIDENTSSQFYADFISLKEPFAYNQTTELTSPDAEISLLGDNLSVAYTTKSNKSQMLSAKLPDGVTAKLSDKSSGFSQMPVIELFKDDMSVGSVYLIGYGADDEQTLSLVDTSSDEMPMMIYSPVALSNMIDYHNGYRVVAYTENSSNAVCYPVDTKTNYHNDCILAYNLSSECYFVMILLAPDTLTENELELFAKSVIIS